MQPKFTTQQQRMIVQVKLGIGTRAEITAVNFSHSTNSSYWLLKVFPDQWLVLRIASHPNWLINAQEVEIDWQNWDEFAGLANKVATVFDSELKFKLTESDQAIIWIIRRLAKSGRVLMVKLPKVVDEAHKARAVDLVTEFPRYPLAITNRNNVNKLVLQVENDEFKRQVATLFGRNFLFSQFTVHSQLKLLPTNQWLNPILQPGQPDNKYIKTFIEEYGINLWNQILPELSSV